jgi:hypothetical protein
MKTQIAHLLRRLTHGAAGCLLGGALMVPMGGALTVPMGPTTTSQAVNQINSMATQPMAPGLAAQRAVVGEPAQWVPDRAVSVPGAGVVVVPGHWERQLEPHQVFVPSLTVRNPQTGVLSTFPAGTYPPVNERLAP